MQLIRTLAISVLMVMASFAQTSLTSTTFSAAVSANDVFVYVASPTGISGRSGVSAVVTMLYSGREAFRVVSVEGTVIRVDRGTSGTRIHAHPSGATVYVGAPGRFFTSAPAVGGSCNGATDQGYSPYIVISTGNHYECVGSIWKSVDLDGHPVTSVRVGVAATGVTAVEKGAGRRHFTTLTVVDLLLIETTGSNNLAKGALMYTFPAGIITVHGASISLELAATTATCDSDQPDLGIGTVVGTGSVATLDGGTGTFENILLGQEMNNMTGTVELKTLGNQTQGIDLAGDHTVFLNIADGWAGNPCVVTADGTVYLDWTLLN